jgi:hypothetical protein
MGGILQVDTIQNNNATTLITQTNSTTLTFGVSGQNIVIPTGVTFNTASATINLPSTINATTINVTTLVLAAGAVGTPSLTTSGDTNTGVFFPAADTIAFTEGGTEVMRITSSGNVGIGTTDPDGTLTVTSTKTGTEGSPHLRIAGDGYSLLNFLDGTAAYIGQNSGVRSLRIYSGSNEAVGANLAAGGTSFGTYSDERLKRNINNLETCINKINSMRPITFNYISDEENFKTRIGISAQSLVGQVDEALDLSKYSDEEPTEYYNVRYQDLIPVLIKGIQEQQAIIEQLKATSISQQTKIDALEARLIALENN